MSSEEKPKPRRTRQKKREEAAEKPTRKATVGRAPQTPAEPTRSTPPPLPRVSTKVGLRVKLRIGKGFSIPELEEVGLTAREGRKLGLKVDPRRRTKQAHNVDLLRRWLGSG